MTFDTDVIERLRAETPGVANVLHLNNAGAGLMPRPVLDAVKNHLDAEAAIGGYEAAEAAEAALRRPYEAIAAYLNCSPDEIAIVENATAAWNQAFFAILETLGPGDRILTAEAEYASNYLTYLKASESRGIVIDVVPSDETGQLDVAALKKMLDGRVRLISVTHIPTNGGLVNPAEAIGRIARDAGVAYLLDACQSVGQRSLDVERIGCDFLTATGRKYLRGPRGTGFLYARLSAQQRFRPATIDLHAAEWVERDRYVWRDDARAYENWENYEAGKVGLGIAVDYMLALGPAAIEARVKALAETLRERLATLPGIEVRDIGAERSGIVAFEARAREARDLARALRERAINVSTSGASSTLIDMQRRGLSRVVRASVHYYNTEDEIDRFVRAVDELGSGR